ncbi:MAG: hypothetical protein IKZ55_09180 [Bacteroidales bacterium]|nr:hypothetical protein [Bacteroidales bacterium]
MLLQLADKSTAFWANDAILGKKEAFGVEPELGKRKIDILIRLFTIIYHAENQQNTNQNHPKSRKTRRKKQKKILTN